MGGSKYASVKEYNEKIKLWKKLSLQWQLCSNVVQKNAIALRVNDIADKVAAMKENLPPGTTFRNGRKQVRPDGVEDDKNY